VGGEFLLICSLETNTAYINHTLPYEFPREFQTKYEISAENRFHVYATAQYPLQTSGYLTSHGFYRIPYPVLLIMQMQWWASYF
jgi:hypothetical protein